MTVRLRRWAAVALLLLGATAGPAAAVAQAVPAPGAASARAAAATLADDVRGFRMDVRATLLDYSGRYGDRLSAAERQRMVALRGQVDRQLTLVQVRVARAERVASSTAPRAERIAAAHEASVAFDRAHASAIGSLAEVEPILRPKLSLFEGLEAKGDLDAMMARYDALGMAIHAFEAEQRA